MATRDRKSKHSVITVGEGPANFNLFATFEHVITSAGTPEQLESLAVPDGMALVIKAKSDNTGKVYIGESQSNLKFSLDAGETVALSISNADLVWLDSDEDDEGIEGVVEV